jgi:hypothetical protein
MHCVSGFQIKRDRLGHVQFLPTYESPPSLPSGAMIENLVLYPPKYDIHTQQQVSVLMVME